MVWDSAIVYVVKLVIPSKTFVSVAVSSSTRLKSTKGDGVAVNANDSGPGRVDTFLTVTDEAKITASLSSDRSMFPEPQLLASEHPKSWRRM